jgi:DNA-binding NarL/FixJ family response regulator
MAVRTEIREIEHDYVGTAVLVDEHPILLDGLERVLADAGIQIVGKATAPETALELIVATAPTIVVASLELTTSQMDGIEFLVRVQELAPKVRIVALSGHYDPFHLSSAIAAGAHAYVPKTAAPAELAETIRNCCSGPPSRAPEVPPAGPDLTGRELEILHLVARGHTNAEIAERLWVTKWTVKFHLANAYRKLGVSNRTQAARYVFDRGLSSLPRDQSA